MKKGETEKERHRKEKKRLSECVRERKEGIGDKER